MKKIGLIGGMSWVSTMEYYRLINEMVNAKLGGLQFAEMVVYSLNFGAIQSKGWDKSYGLLLEACHHLKLTNVDGIALCANTAHLYADLLRDEVDLPIIHIVKETAKIIQKSGYKKVGLMGTKFTMEMDYYNDTLEEFGLKVIIPEKQEIRDYIQQTLKEELGIGYINPATKKEYMRIISDLESRGSECIILGCTEIPLLLGQDDVPLPIFDTTKIHTEAIVNFILQ